MVYIDLFCGIVVSMSDYHPRGPAIDSRLYPRNCSGNKLALYGLDQCSPNLMMLLCRPNSGVVRTPESGFWVSSATSHTLQGLEGDGGNYVVAYSC